MLTTCKYMLGSIPLVLFAEHCHKSNPKPIEITIRGNNRMIVSFKQNVGIKVSSVYHTYNEHKLDSSYSHNCDDLVIEKHTVNDAFIDDFPILSIVLPNNNFANYEANYDTIIKRVSKSSIKTHLVYSTFFTQNNRLILEWGVDAQYIHDDKF